MYKLLDKIDQFLGTSFITNLHGHHRSTLGHPIFLFLPSVLVEGISAMRDKIFKCGFYLERERERGDWALTAKCGRRKGFSPEKIEQSKMRT